MEAVIHRGTSSCERSLVPILCFFASASLAAAATDVRVDFTFHTTDAYGSPLTQNRTFWVYRPDNLSRSAPVPMILVMDGSVSTLLHRKADQAGFVVVSCTYSGNSSGGWIDDDPRIVSYQDFDYTDEVIRRVRASDNTSDAFTVGFSAGGHMALAYACVRPSMLKAAASVDEHMGLTTNIPSAPLPVILMEGTADSNVPYVTVKDTVDVWRAVDGLVAPPPPLPSTKWHRSCQVMSARPHGAAQAEHLKSRL